MNIEEIKEKIDTPKLKLVRQMDEAGQPTEWLTSWDYDTRVRLSVHQDVAKVASKSENLFLKTESKVSASGKDYVSHILCEGAEQAEPEMVL